MDQPMRERVAAAFEKSGGNVSATARELGVHRATVSYHLKKLGVEKPVAAGTIKGTQAESAALPLPGQVKRYIVTSAQNNTYLNEKVWANLLALAEHYEAEVLVGTYSYNQNAYGELSVKQGTKKRSERELWFDERVRPHISDVRRELANGLVWCGEMNIMPTAHDPLSGLETYSGRKSGIFPHAKVSLRSVATMAGEGTKFNYTTGTVTQRNYIQKKAGLVAEHHHSYGGLLVEVDEDGHWWVRQLDADDKGRIQDLTLLVDGGKVLPGQRVEAINWGDLHATTIDETVHRLAVGPDGILNELKPRFQFMHDVMEGVGTNHHDANNPHKRFEAFMRGYDTVATELNATAEVLRTFHRNFCQMVVVDSNHDGDWLYRWLREHDYRKDPRNAVLFLEMQLAAYKSLAAGGSLNLVEWGIRRCWQEGWTGFPKFLKTDESFTICGKRIECGQHGHLGPGGARGTPLNLAKVGRRANVGHYHAAGIYDGLYAAGTSTTLSMGYNRGPSGWSHSHVVTYPSGKRTIVTIYAGKWRA
jgi:hypothetical protein